MSFPPQSDLTERVPDPTRSRRRASTWQTSSSIHRPHSSPRRTAKHRGQGHLAVERAASSSPSKPRPLSRRAMAAAVDGTRKRGAAAFLDDPFEVLQAKRGRCSPSAAAAAVADLGINMKFDPVEALQSVFPGADPQKSDSLRITIPTTHPPNHVISGFSVASDRDNRTKRDN